MRKDNDDRIILAMKISEQADFAERLEAIEKARGIT